MIKLLHLLTDSKESISSIFERVFGHTSWFLPFMDDTHHGFDHAEKVRKACLKIIKHMTEEEYYLFIQEGGLIDQDRVYDVAVKVVERSALLHDCGRFNDVGNIISKEQYIHHIRSEERAKIFCNYYSLGSIIEGYMSDAILGHDYWNSHMTSGMSAPVSIIAKIVQSADQMGRFHPQSVLRCLAFNKDLGLPFLDKSLSLDARLHWKPSTDNYDAVTALLYGLYGPCDKKRFGLVYAREKVKNYKIELKKNILSLAEDYGVYMEVIHLLKYFEENIGNI